MFTNSVPHIYFVQGKPDTRTHYGFEKQLSKVYTKAVYKDFRKKLKKSTLFAIKEDPELLVPHYLVRFKKPCKVFSWSQHEFKVEADPTGGKYKCECMNWEHTGTSKNNRSLVEIVYILNMYVEVHLVFYDSTYLHI